MSTHIKIADAIRDYYEMLEQLSSEELEQLIPSVLKLEGNAINQRAVPDTTVLLPNENIQRLKPQPFGLWFFCTQI